MKTLSVLAMACLLYGIPTYSQSQNVEKFYENYAANSAFYCLEFSSGLLARMTNSGTEKDERTVRDAFAKVRQIKMLHGEAKNANKTTFQEDLEKLVSNVCARKFERAWQSYNPEQSSGILVAGGKKSAKTIVLYVVKGEKQTFMVLEGDMDIKKISQAAPLIKISEFAELNRLDIFALK